MAPVLAAPVLNTFRCYKVRISHLNRFYALPGIGLIIVMYALTGIGLIIVMYALTATGLIIAMYRAKKTGQVYKNILLHIFSFETEYELSNLNIYKKNKYKLATHKII